MPLTQGLLSSLLGLTQAGTMAPATMTQAAITPGMAAISPELREPVKEDLAPPQPLPADSTLPPLQPGKPLGLSEMITGAEPTAEADTIESGMRAILKLLPQAAQFFGGVKAPWLPQGLQNIVNPGSESGNMYV